MLGKAQYDYVTSWRASDIKKIALLYEDHRPTAPRRRWACARGQAAGAQIVLDEAQRLGITDVTPLISKLRGLMRKILVLISSEFDASLLIIRVMRQQRPTVPVVGGAADTYSRLRQGTGPIPRRKRRLAPVA